MLSLAAVPSVAQEDDSAKRAREELEKELKALTTVAPPRIEILYEATPGFRLVEAEFTLDDVKLVTPAVDALNADGPQPVFAARVAPGRHVLVTRLVLVRSVSSIFSYASAYRWRLETRATFDTSPGIEVRVRAQPVKVPGAQREKDELTLRHELEGTVLAPVEAPAPAPPPDAGAPVDAGAPAPPPEPAPGKVLVTTTAGAKPLAAEVRRVGGAPAASAITAAAAAPTPLELPPGTHALEVLAPGHLAQARVVTVESGVETPLAVQLVRAPAKPSVVVAGEVLTLKKPLLFDAKKGALGAGAGPLIAELVDAVVRGRAKALRVEVHTDNRGDAAALQQRSEAHAEAIAAALRAAGLEASRVEAAGFGGSRPIAANLTPGGRKRNNRVELRLVAQ